MKILLKSNILDKETHSEPMPFSFYWLNQRLFFIAENIGAYLPPSNDTYYSAIEVKCHKGYLFTSQTINILTLRKGKVYGVDRIEVVPNPNDRLTIWHETLNCLFITLRNDRDIIHSVFNTSIIPFLVKDLEELPQKANLFILGKTLELILWDTFILKGTLSKQNKIYLSNIQIVEKSANLPICALSDMNLESQLYLEECSLEGNILEDFLETVPEEDLIDIFLTALKMGHK